MSIYVGTSEIKNIYVGTTPVKAVYLGTQKVRPSVGPEYTPTANTILYFPLRENAVDKIHSVSMTMKGNVQWTTPSGANIPCAYFASGGGFYKTSATSYLPTGTSARTISGWVKPTGTSRFSVASYGAQGTNQLFCLYTFADSGSNFYKFRFTQWGSGSGYGQTISTNNRYNVVITYSGSSIIWYINGTQDASWSRSLSTVNSNLALGLDMSAGSWTSSTGLIGYLSEVIFENRVWSAAEVQTYYNTYKSNYGL